MVSHGWKPGAISKKLLRMLNKAKSPKSTAEIVKRTKRTKKQIEDKPTFIVCKHNGQYHIELQATPENHDECPEHYTPLIFKVESSKYKSKSKKKEKIQKRLVNAALKEVWTDPYHPEACEDVCLPVYNRTVGVAPQSGDDCTTDEEPMDSDSCSSDDDDEISSSCNSSEVDWEIHFTPPYVTHQIATQESNNDMDFKPIPQK